MTDYDRVWYHGSPQQLAFIRAGSTVTQGRRLAEIFSHKPAVGFHRGRRHDPAQWDRVRLPVPDSRGRWGGRRLPASPLHDGTRRRVADDP